jgi:phosphate transport system permease protein
MRRKRLDRMFGVLCFLSASVGVLLLVVFLARILSDGIGRLDWRFVQAGLSSRPNRTGIWPAVAGSLWVMGFTFVIAVPVGIAAAIFLEEFNSRKSRLSQFIQLNIANLAGVPSIVYGMLGLAVFVRWLALRESVLSGALTMSLLILPMVILVTQEALRAVPDGYRDGSIALGSTYWQAIRYQVLPNALPGILTGVILSVSRAAGETAPLIVVGAAAYVSSAPKSIGDRYTVLPIKIFDWAEESKHAFNQAAATAILVLMIALLVLNSVAIYIRSRSRNQRHG